MVMRALVRAFLDGVPGYTGSVGSLRLHPFDGTVELTGLTLRKKISREHSVPFLSARKLIIAPMWRALLRGVFVRRVVVEGLRGELDMAVWGRERSPRPSAERRRSAPTSLLSQLLHGPTITIDEVLVRDAEVRIVNGPAGDMVGVHDLQVRLHDLSNHPMAPACVSAKGRIAPDGVLDFGGAVRITPDGFCWNASLKVRDADLVAWRPLLKREWGIDVESGTMDLVAEAKSNGTLWDGYAKPVLTHLRLVPAPRSGIWGRIKGSIAQGVAWLLRNKPWDQVATKIHFGGALTDPSVDVWHTVANFFRNAFVSAFDARREWWRFGQGGPSLERHVEYGSPASGSRSWFALLKTAFSRWLDHNVPQMSAALSYYTSFSLAPLLLLVVVMLGFVFGREAAEGRIMAGLTDVVGRQSAQTIQSMVAAAWRPGRGIFALVASVVMLLIGAFGVLSELRDGLNRVMKVHEEGSLGTLIKARFKFLGFILGIGFLLLVSLVVSTGLSAVARFMAGVLPFPSLILHGVDLLVSIGVISLVFALIYKYLPAADTSWHAVWVGSIFSAVLFTLGKFALGLYLGRTAVSSSYGAAGSVLLILLWVYYSALISYFGAEFMAVYAERDARGT